MVIFGTGVLTGALVVHYSVNVSNSRPQRANFGSPVGMRFEFLRRIQRDLDLTAEQREQIDKVLKQSQERTRKIMEPVVPQMHQELQRSKAEFRAVLTPAQQTRFDDLCKQQQRFKGYRPGRSESSLTNAPVTNSI